RIAAAHASLRAAAAAFAAGDPAGTVAEIVATPTDMRGWESRHLLSALGNRDLVERTDVEIIDLCAIDAPRAGDADAVVGCTGGVLGFVDLDRVRPSEWLDLRPFHTTGVNPFFRGIDATPDGRRVVATLNDGSVLAIDRDRDEARRVASGRSTAFIVDDGIIAIDHSARATRVGWDGEALGEVATAGASWGRDFERSRDRTAIAIAGDDGSLRVLRPSDDGRPVDAVVAPPRANGARVAALSADGARVFTWSADGRIASYDTRDGRLVAERDLPGGSVFDLRVSPDGRTLAASSWVPNIRLVDAETLEIVDVLGGTSSHVWGIDFLPDGRLLGRCVLEAPPDGAGAPEWLAAWRIEDSVAIADLPLGRGVVRAAAIDGTSTFLLLDERGVLSLLDASTGHESIVDADATGVTTIGAGAGPGLCATAHADGEIRLHERAGDDEGWRLRWTARPLSGTPTALGLAPDGRTVVVGTRGLDYAVVDAASGSVRWSDRFDRDPMLVDREQLTKPLFADRGRLLVFAAIRGGEPMRFQRLGDGARVDRHAIDGRFQAFDGVVRADDDTILLLGVTGPLLEATAAGAVRVAPIARNQGVIALDAGEGRLFAATRDGAMRVIATSTDASAPTTLLSLESPASRPLAIAFDPARDAVTVVSARGIVRTWSGRLGPRPSDDETDGLAHALLDGRLGDGLEARPEPRARAEDDSTLLR
ncbi:MAG: hypothetical protein RIS86_799, partial [Planctomycetota bacterium]